MYKAGETKATPGNWLSLILGMLSLFLLLLAFPDTGIAASVDLDWDPSTDADLAGYKVYYSVNSASLPFGAAGGGVPIDKANLTTTIDGLDSNNW